MWLNVGVGGVGVQTVWCGVCGRDAGKAGRLVCMGGLVEMD